MSLISLGLALLVLPAALAANYPVSVGAGGKLVFDPETVSASAGDTVTFTFNPKAHSVTQSSFTQPCTPLSSGFDSGLLPVAADTTTLPTFQVTVNDSSTPVWVHCKQQGPPIHCAQGMVFAINAPADPDPHSFSAFKALANSTNATSTSASSSSSAYITPPAPSVVTATATVTTGASIWTTTYGSYVGSSAPTPAAQPAQHKIIVGDNGQLAYNPSNISASIGDTVVFEFHAKNHTVTQSSFLKPCQPLGDTVPDQAGFKSGFMPVSTDATTFPTFQITVNDTAPIWGYCGQMGPPDHCGSGMVFSINAIESGANNFAAFQSLAKQINGTTSTSGSASPSSTQSGASRVFGRSGYLNVVLLLLSVGLGVVYL